MLTPPHNFFSQINVCKCFPHLKKSLSPFFTSVFTSHPQSPHFSFQPFYFAGISFQRSPGTSWFPDPRASLPYSSSFTCVAMITLTIWNLKLLISVYHTLLFLLWPLLLAFLHSSSSSLSAENRGISLDSRCVPSSSHTLPRRYYSYPSNSHISVPNSDVSSDLQTRPSKQTLDISF